MSCKTDKKQNLVSTKEETLIETPQNINVESLTYETLEPLLQKKDDTTYVINFWATWCKPCVKELPAFEELHKKYKDQNVKVLLVSLDFPNQIDKRVIPFIKEHNLQPEVVLMADPDQNNWIPKVSEKWSGAIPATLIYNNSSRAFYEQSFTYKELQTEVHKFLTNQ
jgi:thiol-disulfide isomerase/thioredoxin